MRSTTCAGADEGGRTDGQIGLRCKEHLGGCSLDMELGEEALGCNGDIEFTQHGYYLSPNRFNSWKARFFFF